MYFNMKYFLLLAAVAAASAVPAAERGAERDPVVMRVEPEGERYQYVWDGAGRPHLADSWLRLSDLQRALRYNPDTQNQYHLFTRQNPSVSQPLVNGYTQLLFNSNFDARKRTAVIIHGWTNDATSDINAQLVPAFLAAEDMNVIVVDWGVGAADLNYFVALNNAIISGASVARFLSWVNSATGATLSQYHVAGHSLGGHQAGIVSRNLNRQVAYVTALDPAMPGWLTNSERFAANDGVYTEVIHTNINTYGYPTPLGDSDFYPNGGRNMTGCNSNGCDHSRAYFYFAESLRTGGFLSISCPDYDAATTGDCFGPGTLNMGGIRAKPGSSGIYYLETNGGSPFSRG